MSNKVWKIVQAHVPMIKFRKGGVNKAVQAPVKSASAPSSGSGAAPSRAEGATGPNVVVLPTVDDFQLPQRFQRRPVGIKEMEYINRGGPE